MSCEHQFKKFQQINSPKSLFILAKKTFSNAVNPICCNTYCHHYQQNERKSYSLSHSTLYLSRSLSVGLSPSHSLCFCILLICRALQLRVDFTFIRRKTWKVRPFFVEFNELRTRNFEHSDKSHQTSPNDPNLIWRNST